MVQDIKKYIQYQLYLSVFTKEAIDKRMLALTA